MICIFSLKERKKQLMNYICTRQNNKQKKLLKLKKMKMK
jgi:hypothetical protein